MASRLRVFLLSLFVALAAQSWSRDSWADMTPEAAARTGEARGRAASKLSANGKKQKSSGNRYEISVITFGPGDHAFLKFGHNAIWVSDRLRRRDLVYNFGSFSFESDSLIGDFLQGRLRYWVSVDDLESTVRSYEREGRSAEAQLLDLTAAQAETLVKQLATAALPENRYYIYDYYEDNCSTRVRDMIDGVTGGSLRAVSGEPAWMSWREHTMRLSQDDLPVSIGLDVALGPKVDEANTVWEEMFLPSALARTLDKATVERAGKSRPLVKRKYFVLTADRPPEPTETPRRWPVMLLIGITWGGLAYGLSFFSVRHPARSVKRRAALVGLWSLTAVSGLVLGLLGSIFVFFWVGTDHQIAYKNENIFHMLPVAVFLPLLAVLAPFLRRAPLYAFVLVSACAASSLAGLLLGFLPWFIQNTREFVVFSVPLWLGLVGAFRIVSRSIESENARVGEN